MLSHSRAFIQLKSQPCFTVRHPLEQFREKGWIKKGWEVKDIKYLHLAELLIKSHFSLLSAILCHQTILCTFDILLTIQPAIPHFHFKQCHISLCHYHFFFSVFSLCLSIYYPGRTSRVAAAASIIICCLGPRFPKGILGTLGIYKGVISYLVCTPHIHSHPCDRVTQGMGCWMDSSETATWQRSKVKWQGRKREEN